MPSSDRFQKRPVTLGFVTWAGFSLILLVLLLFSSLYSPLPAHAGTTFTVNSLLDTDGTTCTNPCTLRQAIKAANATVGQDVINFSVSGIITPSTPLPALLDDAGTIIDGGNGFAITISGAEAGNSDHGIKLWSQNNTVKGLAIRGFAGSTFAAIYTDRSNNTILNNYIGPDASGSSITFPNGNGIYIKSNSTAGVDVQNITISGNVIAGNSEAGIAFFKNTNGAVSNITVTNNIIGPDATGNNLITNLRQKYGVFFNGDISNVTLGGTSANHNIISGNYEAGVYFLSDSAGGNVVVGNYIGTDSTGTAPLGGTGSKYCAQGGTLPQKRGIYVLDTNSGITIGGDTAGSGNLISGNCEAGIYFENVSGAGNRVAGNIIGPNSTGNFSFYPCDPQNFIAQVQLYGIYFNGAVSGVTIGGSNKNIISANCDTGIYLNSSNTSAVQILGNYIGPDSNGIKAIGNYSTGNKYQLNGVVFQDNTSNVLLGGNPPNVISGNQNNGILTNNLPASTNGNRIAGNYIGPSASGNAFNATTPQSIGILVNGSTLGTTNLSIGGPGTTADTRNIISGNASFGIRIQNSSKNIQLSNNWIGLKPDGSHLRNTFQGIVITSGSQLKPLASVATAGNRINNAP